MLNNKEKGNRSRFLSLVLRHRPESIGITLDAQGWTDIKTLIDRSSGRLNRDLVTEIVRACDKQRFAISDDGLRIRANQGHSVPVDLGLPARVPPAQLFHGTADKHIGNIRHQGLRSRKRHHVHLSGDVETAKRVGGRHGTPHVLGIDATRMHADGLEFFLSENGVWLTEAVKPEYIDFDTFAAT